MKVIKQRSVDAAIRTLSDEDRRKVFAWLDHLENWENDEHVRKMSKKTIYHDVYVLNTSDDIRIFFISTTRKARYLLSTLPSLPVSRTCL
jgi:hypothetical protein